MLLSNSVIGSVDDLGAVYYNPGRLGLIENPAFVITGKIYQLSKTSFQKLTGDTPDATIRRSRFGGAPSLMAGSYKIDKWKKHHFAYAFLTRRNIDLSVKSSVDSFGDEIDELPGNEYLSGGIELNKRLKEEWFGGTWSYVPVPDIGLGVTGFATVHDQEAFQRMQLQTYTAEGNTEMYYNFKRYDFSQLGLLLKFGFAWETDKLSVGLTLTTPTMHILGKGALEYERFGTYSSSGDQIYEKNQKEKLKVRYRTPLAIGGGLGYDILGGKLHISGEYYHKINHYTIMEGETFWGQSSNREITPLLSDHLKSIFNYGFGYSREINKTINFYLSYSSDYSSAIQKSDNTYDTNNGLMLSTHTSKVNHWAGGIVLELNRSDVTFGVAHAMSKFPISRPVDFPENVDHGLTINPDETAFIKWERWRFIVGISVSLLEDVATRLEKKVLSPGKDK
ncbi:hypothetical protein [Draconibacterium sp. IB214405]|uniref:hypothetical protein n=1 Tax=Draconibacterium sp. IB214405 TaxID=3097352 RepID=UPI002A244238|nr:hypothetical protein [Draconibacterium sp. IB214405]